MDRTLFKRELLFRIIFLLLGKFTSLFLGLLFTVFTIFRETVRRTMHALDPAGPARRFPSKRPPKVRSTLTDSAVYYEVHLDGHEKLNFKALRMGRASIDMYGGRCHGSGYIVDMAVVPNARCLSTIGHLYLDLVESTGDRFSKHIKALSKQFSSRNPGSNYSGWWDRATIYVPISRTTSVCQHSFDLDNELIICSAQFLPDVSSTEVPACVALKSSDNIPIEALWSYFLKYTGHDLKAGFLLGKTENYINVTNEVHMCVVKFCAVLFLIAWVIEIFSTGYGPESCKTPSTTLCNTGTLTKLESRVTSICPQVSHLRQSFSIRRTLAFGTQAFQWILWLSVNFEICFPSLGRTAFAGFRLSLIYMPLPLMNFSEARNCQFRRGGPFTAGFWKYCNTRIVSTHIWCHQ